MGRLFSLISMMAFVLMMVAVPMVAVFGLPQINPPFKELGDKLKESAMNKIRGSIVSDQDHVNDPNSPLYGLETETKQLTEAAAWGGPQANMGFDQFSDSQGVHGNLQPASFQQQPGNSSGVNQAVLNQSDQTTQHPPLMKTLLTEQQSQAPKSGANGVVPAAFSRSVPSRQQGMLNQPQEQRASLTFMQATKILQEMGIKEYSLEPGTHPDQFYFVCLYTPADNPSVTTRFEAEANDPMVAVENVLQQIRQTLQPKPAVMNQTSFNQSSNNLRR